MNNKKKKSSNRLSTEMTSEKIKIIKDIDLNSIFKLNYNFDVLKGLIFLIIYKYLSYLPYIKNIN